MAAQTFLYMSSFPSITSLWWEFANIRSIDAHYHKALVPGLFKSPHKKQVSHRHACLENDTF